MMRIDKYLKTSRLIKRRTIAKEACDQERILLNDKPAKAGSDVKIGDVIQIKFGTNAITVRVANLSESCRKEDAQTMYEII